MGKIERPITKCVALCTNFWVFASFTHHLSWLHQTRVIIEKIMRKRDNPKNDVKTQKHALGVMGQNRPN